MSSKKSPSDDVDEEFDNEDGINGGNDDHSSNQQEDMMDMLSSIMQHQEQHQAAAGSSSTANNAAAAASGQLSDSAAILQMLQQMNVREVDVSDKKKPHTFWDTQVSFATNKDGVPPLTNLGTRKRVLRSGRISTLCWGLLTFLHNALIIFICTISIDAKLIIHSFSLFSLRPLSPQHYVSFIISAHAQQH